MSVCNSQYVLVCCMNTVNAWPNEENIFYYLCSSLQRPPSAAMMMVRPLCGPAGRTWWCGWCTWFCGVYNVSPVPVVVVLAMVGAVRLASCEGGEVLGRETYILFGVYIHILDHILLYINIWYLVAGLQYLGRISLAHPVSIPGYFGANVVHADASVLDKGYFLIAIWIFPLGRWRGGYTQIIYCVSVVKYIKGNNMKTNTVDPSGPYYHHPNLRKPPAMCFISSLVNSSGHNKMLIFQRQCHATLPPLAK